MINLKPTLGVDANLSHQLISDFFSTSAFARVYVPRGIRANGESSTIRDPARLFFENQRRSGYPKATHKCGAALRLQVMGQKHLEYKGLFGAPSQTRTGDPLIKRLRDRFSGSDLRHMLAVPQRNCLKAATDHESRPC